MITEWIIVGWLLLEAHSPQRLGGHKTWTSLNKNIDTLTGQLEAQGPTDASNIQQVGPFGKLLSCALPLRSLCRLFIYILFSENRRGAPFFRCLTITLSGRGHFYLEMNIPAKPAMFPCVKEGRVPKWANATGRRCKMSTLLYHPLEIDCITSRNVAPRINRDALFQDRRWWAQSAGWTLPLSLLLGTTDNAWKNL